MTEKIFAKQAEPGKLYAPAKPEIHYLRLATSKQGKVIIENGRILLEIHIRGYGWKRFWTKDTEILRPLSRAELKVAKDKTRYARSS